MPGIKRQQIVDQFQADISAFGAMILSPKAGGVGLTITAANHVIHLSRWWNPAVEDQSTDRAFRIGQEKPVTVYYPMAIHPSTQIGEQTFDTKLDNLLAKKRALSSKMLIPQEVRDQDAASLFNAIVDAKPYSEDSDVQAQMVREQTEIAVQTEVPEEGAIAETIQCHVFPEGQTIDYDTVFAGLSEFEFDELVLIDPFPFWRARGQLALVMIAREIERRTKGIRLVRFITAVPQMVSDRDFQTEEEAIHKIRTNFALAYRELGPPPKITFETKRRRREQDFHDRYIDLYKKQDGRKTVKRFAVPRGLDAFGDAKFRLEIYAHPTHEEIRLH